MPRLLGGIEPHIVSRTTPGVTRTGEQIVDDVLLVVAEPHLSDGHVNHPVLRVERIGVDGDQDLAVRPRRATGRARRLGERHARDDDWLLTGPLNDGRARSLSIEQNRRILARVKRKIARTAGARCGRAGAR